MFFFVAYVQSRRFTRDRLKRSCPFTLAVLRCLDACVGYGDIFGLIYMEWVVPQHQDSVSIRLSVTQPLGHSSANFPVARSTDLLTNVS